MAQALGIFVAGTLGTMVLGLLSKWFDRKLTARVQYRVGPPLLQPFYDILKLLGKETLVPADARRSGFLLAPLVGLSATAVAAGILWASAVNPAGAFVGDLIVLLYVLTLPSLSLVVGGSASGNPFGAVGASREIKLLIAYELPLITAIVTALVHAEAWSFRLADLAAHQAAHGPIAASLSGALALLVSLFCIQAKLGLVPFDTAEADTELMGGVLVEYSGPPLALIHLFRAMLLAVLPMLLITVFLGGIRLSWPGILGTLLAYLLILVFVVLLRNTNPRLRIDQAVKFFWLLLFPIAMLALILALAGY
ncbi:NADH-quinone oxidoreductase subunit H [bacterium]|nr:NADH-quinone oxidoreductase subunit H [bacterium]